MIPVISGTPGLPDFTPILFVNLTELYLLCQLGGGGIFNCNYRNLIVDVK